MKSKQTSTPIGRAASTVMQDGRFSDTARSLAASALSQTRTGKESSPAMASLASRVLQDERFSDTTRSLAASVLSQAK